MHSLNQGHAPALGASSGTQPGKGGRPPVQARPKTLGDRPPRTFSSRATNRFHCLNPRMVNSASTRANDAMMAITTQNHHRWSIGLSPPKLTGLTFTVCALRTGPGSSWQPDDDQGVGAGGDTRATPRAGRCGSGSAALAKPLRPRPSASMGPRPHPRPALHTTYPQSCARRTIKINRKSPRRWAPLHVEEVSVREQSSRSGQGPAPHTAQAQPATDTSTASKPWACLATVDMVTIKMATGTPPCATAVGSCGRLALQLCWALTLKGHSRPGHQGLRPCTAAYRWSSTIHAQLYPEACCVARRR